MHSSRLPSLFLVIAVAALAEGCGGHEIDRSRFKQDVCTAGQWKPLQRITPAAGIDAIELRSGTDVDGKPQVIASFGTLCGAAKDRAACEAAVDALHSSDIGWTSTNGFTFNRQYLVSTSGDAVRLHTTAAQVVSAFGSVDTADEAAFVATIGTDHRVRCGSSANVRGDGSIELLTETGSGCGKNDDVELHVVVVQPNGSMQVTETETLKDSDPNCVVGRRPEGLASTPRGDESLGAFFARMAHLEAAAVPAFERLVSELTAHGAPRALIAAAKRAARDEVRHARAVAKLARRFGGVVPPVVVEELPIRSLEEIARENATEGCVRETFGALVATYQARAARDEQIAKVMRGIARDETRHAQLSWDVAAWALSQLDGGARARIDVAVANAVAELRRDLITPACREAIELAGFPDRERALAMLDRLVPEVWAA